MADASDVHRWIVSQRYAAALSAAIQASTDLEQKVPSDIVIAAGPVSGWSEHGAWLLLFDNAPEPEAVRDYFPRGGGGHLIVTCTVVQRGTPGQGN